MILNEYERSNSARKHTDDSMGVKGRVKLINWYKGYRVRKETDLHSKFKL